MVGIARRLFAEVKPYAPGFRRVFLVVVLAAEALGVSVYFDPWLLLKNNPNWSGWVIANSSAFLRIAVAFTGGLLVVLGPRLRDLSLELNRIKHRYWRVWLLAHLLSFGVFIFLSVRLLKIPDGSFHLPVVWFISWLTLSVTTFAFWLLAFAPVHFWGRLIRREYIALSVASLAAIAAWAGGLLAQKLWRPLAETTFWLAHLLLDSVYPSIASDAKEGTLGTAAFQVHIAPACSGYEGMALVTVFVAVYVWLLRNELRFPQALLLFPLGILAIYLANIIRLAALILLGTHISPEVAVSGFHSQAGWIAFTVIAVGVIAGAHRMPFFKDTDTQFRVTGKTHLATALLTPFLLMLAAAMIAAAFSADFNQFYPLQVIVTAAAIWHFRRGYSRLGWEWSWQAVAMGIAVFGVWIILEPASDPTRNPVAAGLAELPYWAAGIWIFFRVIGSVIAVPLAEELAFRGYLIRKLIARDFENIPLNRFTWFSFLLSSVLFGLLHDGRWIAGIITGMLFALALYRRGQLGDAVVAHVTANALIAAYVLVYAKWGLWS
ncbi:MAG: exosortase E/protease, VPEID-CTERM system [Pseudomonadota bacterium]